MLHAGATHHSFKYGPGEGGDDTILLDELDCSGTESSVFACPHRGLNEHNCDHVEDVGVKCQG